MILRGASDENESESESESEGGTDCLGWIFADLQRKFTNFLAMKWGR